MTGLSAKMDAMIANLGGRVGLVVNDLKDGSATAHDEDAKFSAASIIKIPILWRLCADFESGAISPHGEIVVRDAVKVGGTGILKEMHDGIVVTVMDLATLMIVVSDNTATNLIIDMVGMDRVNRTMSSLGLRDSSLQRKMMDFEAKKAGRDNHISARDMALLLERLVTANGLGKEYCDLALNIMLRQQLNNKLPRGLLLCPACRKAVKDYPQCPWCYEDLRKNPPAGARLAHKTGELAGVEHDAGVLFLKERPIIIVVLTADLKNNEDGIRFIGDVAAEVARHYSV